METRLDERFSDPGTEAAGWADTVKALEAAQISWLTTVRATGRDAWDDALDVVVEGVARRVTDRAKLERLAEAWLAKWDGSWVYEATDDGFRQGGHDAVVFAVEPAKVLAFGRKRTSPTDTSMLSTVEFTHTSHRP
ncbi:pyridoxamine 5'-phosphate oxidase family protein [Amycolatopsis mongoliensis]|uniref:Pyridoxamine 5'-phosphate oxidase family protein n=1 Tax=Amycolatopsis mongoliensis TaxID=715475 RepID=A0A9Y2NEW6_9PSEU|nr:pyridoxamine 5'-phosphate oxidase family protein [Amycolatopsis sp. 4-36]WIX99113.1 pyridoxamine 5'-phosphate oxidase family protein [Amycolatopsis sp. 4-36]